MWPCSSTWDAGCPMTTTTSRRSEQTSKKARSRWAKFSRVLTREGANTRMMATFYKTIIQSVLLYGSETWSLTEREFNLLASFHKKCVRCITHRWNRPRADGTWDCPNMRETYAAANIEPIEHYIEKRKSKLQHYAKDRAVYRRCKRINKTPRSSHKVVWWN